MVFLFLVLKLKGKLKYIDERPSFIQNKIREYLVKGKVIIGDSKETIFNEMFQLEPGSNLLYKNNEVRIDKFWKININISKASRAEHVFGFKKLFQDSLMLRMRSDVEVGSCLSGGIDSSSIVGFASKIFNVKFNIFSAI